MSAHLEHPNAYGGNERRSDKGFLKCGHVEKLHLMMPLKRSMARPGINRKLDAAWYIITLPAKAPDTIASVVIPDVEGDAE